MKFIFSTTEPQKVLPTILSRCQRFDLHRIPANLIADHLQFIAGKEKVTLEPAAAHAIAKGADGGLRDAESMLDQLVAFCGESIAEADVLNVFGFTSEQTVARFTEQILQGNTADALELLHSEADNGKDMMKLMSDMIAYLRDLLVFKVKPDAVTDEFNPELQHALQTQAGLVETDRLLELIDQFASAEGRMKWAPNKKLHFEVAVIKAIQTLEQVTLNEVIENLSALRDGTAQPVSPRPRSAPVEPPKPLNVTKPAAPPKTQPPTPKPPATAQEEAKAPVAQETATPPQDDAAAPADAETIWSQAVAQIRTRRPLIRSWIESARPLGTEGRFFHVGFPPEQKTAMESLSMPRTRDFLQALLKEISGRDWDLKFSVKEGLVVEPPPESESAPAANGAAAAKRPVDTVADFKDDPLIRKALEIFKGEIKPVTE